MATKLSGIMVLLMTAGVLSLIHGAARVAFQDFTAGAPTLAIGVVGTAQAFYMIRRTGSGS